MTKKSTLLLLSLLLSLSLCAQTASRPRVALVLGGGGAKGAATVGVLKAVEESGVPIDMVVGTSIGSIVGGLYSLGYRSEQIDSMFRSQEWLELFTGSLMGDSIVRTLRGMTAAALSSMPQHGCGKGDQSDSLSFDSLPIPFRCVAVDMLRMREVVLSSGSLAEAMRASMAIPLVFKPVKMGNMRLVDGGVLNNLPVDVARDMGADFVIAVDLTVNKHENGLSGLNALLRPDLKKYGQNCEDADVYINPDLKGYGAQDFMPRKIAEMIAIGEKAGHHAQKDLKKLKKQLAKGKK
ncbi:MAG: patatin-like phospholipase family protein [Bacteroidaceae bacterium]|nr:patatin-like phospholipase family protein [Bacteroidaceae bacterium]